MTIIFKMNRKIEVFSLDDKKIGDSTVQDEDENCIAISVPFGPKGFKSLHPGEKVRAIYCGDDNKVYDFVSEVIDFKKDHILLIKLSKPEEYDVIQRRQYVRIPIMLDMEYCILEEMVDIKNVSASEVKKIYKDFKWKKGYTYDLSAGGTGTVFQEAVALGNKVLFFFKDDELKSAFIGEVVRVITNTHAGDKLFKIGIRFMNLEYQTEEKLVQYIFQKMRDHLKVR